MHLCARTRLRLICRRLLSLLTLRTLLCQTREDGSLHTFRFLDLADKCLAVLGRHGCTVLIQLGLELCHSLLHHADELRRILGGCRTHISARRHLAGRISLLLHRKSLATGSWSTRWPSLLPCRTSGEHPLHDRRLTLLGMRRLSGWLRWRSLVLLVKAHVPLWDSLLKAWLSWLSNLLLLLLGWLLLLLLLLLYCLLPCY